MSVSLHLSVWLQHCFIFTLFMSKPNVKHDILVSACTIKNIYYLIQYIYFYTIYIYIVYIYSIVIFHICMSLFE